MDVRRRFLDDYVEGSGGSGGSYTLTLNSKWQKSTTVSNPDSTLYDGVYESYSNYNVNSGVAIMYIDITGYSDFKLYIRSNGEPCCDYVMVSQLDKTITGSSTYSDTSIVKAHTCYNQQSGTALSNYTLVEFTNIDGGSHRITVLYRKDGSVNSGTDKGYLLIQGGTSYDSGDEGGGDVDIDTTYSITYTSTDGSIVTPYKTTGFGANITSNTYVDGVGLICFDGPVTTIGSSVFSGCRSLQDIIIPNSVTSIGNDAFRYCEGLVNINIPNNVTSIGDYAFYSCKSLESSITIPNGVTTIGKEAFYFCTSITSITIPDSVTSVGEGAFYSCSALSNIVLGSSMSTTSKNMFVNCKSLINVTIPDNITTIGEYSFNGCNNMSNITLHDGIKSISTGAFTSCRSLTDISLPNQLTTISEGAFSGCSGLTSITIPEKVTIIGDKAFNGCSKLSSFYGKGATSDNLSLVYFSELKAFALGSNVTSYEVPTGVNYISGYAFEGAKNLKNIIIGNDVINIKLFAFNNCDSLESITFGDNVTSIGEQAFGYCEKLENIVFGASVNYISNYAFYHCEGLDVLHLPNSIGSIGSNAFAFCYSLDEIYCQRSTPPSISSNTFNSNASNRKIYVPTASVDTYKSESGWSTYANYIVGYDF